MPPARTRLYAELYRGFQMTRDWQGVEQEVRPRLTALGFDRTLTEPEKAEYLNVLGQLDQLSLRMANRQLIDEAAEGGLKLKASAVAEESRRLRASPGREACTQNVSIPMAPG
jgi:hypothetical protein